MKSKLLVVFTTLMLAVAMMAQTGTSATPAPAATDNKTCACCNHDTADAKDGASGCSDCCKDGKCAMMSKNGIKEGAKCPMMAKGHKMADGKMCCSADKCPMSAKNGKGAAACCCGNMSQHEHAGV